MHVTYPCALIFADLSQACTTCVSETLFPKYSATLLWETCFRNKHQRKVSETHVVYVWLYNKMNTMYVTVLIKNPLPVEDNGYKYIYQVGVNSLI